MNKLLTLSLSLCCFAPRLDFDVTASGGPYNYNALVLLTGHMRESYCSTEVIGHYNYIAADNSDDIKVINLTCNPGATYALSGTPYKGTDELLTDAINVLSEILKYFGQGGQLSKLGIAGVTINVNGDAIDSEDYRAKVPGDKQAKLLRYTADAIQEIKDTGRFPDKAHEWEHEIFTRLKSKVRGARIGKFRREYDESQLGDLTRVITSSLLRPSIQSLEYTPILRCEGTAMISEEVAQWIQSNRDCVRIAYYGGYDSDQIICAQDSPRAINLYIDGQEV